MRAFFDLKNLQLRRKQLQLEAYSLFLAYKDPRMPWYARLLTACVIGYAFNPLDLIPDFIPILGFLDDLILVPLGITIALKMIPGPVLAECRRKAQLELAKEKPRSWVATAATLLIWIMVTTWILSIVLRWVEGSVS